jgi:hypothetical protein
VKKFEKTVACLLALGVIAVVIFSAQQHTSAQVSNGARRGFTATDRDTPEVTGHGVYRIPLDAPSLSVEMGTTNVPQELEGFHSIDNGETGKSMLFGVGENCITTCIAQSALVNLTSAAVDPNGLGNNLGPTNIDFGTEAGSAWDPISGQVYAIASDDLLVPPQTRLYVQTGATTFSEINTSNIYLDGLAVGGNGVLYATDARITDTLYRFDFDLELWVAIDSNGNGLGVALNEDSGLACYRGLGGNETNLYMITEGDGANLGRLWTIALGTGDASLVGEIRLAVDGSEVPEDIEGFEIPYFPLDGEQ